MAVNNQVNDEILQQQYKHLRAALSARLAQQDRSLSKPPTQYERDYDLSQ